MKAITIMNNIQKKQACSIHDIELLNKALYRENGENVTQVKFLPLYRQFMLVKSRYNAGNTPVEILVEKWFNDDKTEYSEKMTFGQLYIYFTRNGNKF